MIEQIKKKIYEDSDNIFLIDIRKLKKNIKIKILDVLMRNGFDCDRYNDRIKSLTIALMISNKNLRAIIMTIDTQTVRNDYKNAYNFFDVHYKDIINQETKKFINTLFEDIL